MPSPLPIPCPARGDATPCDAPAPPSRPGDTPPSTLLATDALSFTVGAHPVAIELDGRPCHVAAGSTLADLVAALGHAPHAVATAVDGRHVPRSQRGMHRLVEGAAVLIFQPIVGG